MMDLETGSDTVSGTSKASDIRVESAARAARIATELSFFDEEAKHESNLRKLKLKKQLAVAKAEIKAIDEYSRSSRSSNSSHGRRNILDRYLSDQARFDGDLITIDNTGSADHVVSLPMETVPKIVTSNDNLNAHDPAGSFECKVNLDNDDPHVDRLSVSNVKNLGTSNFVPNVNANNFIPYNDRFSAPCHTNEIIAPNETSDPITLLANLLSQKQDRDTLPRPEPDVFNGDVLKYPIWSKSFKALIESRTNKPAELLYYLGRYTSDTAKEAITGLLSLDTGEAYSKAQSILQKRFGDPFLISSRFRKKIEEWPEIKGNDGPALRKFSDFLQSCHVAMDTTPYLNSLNEPDENERILSKFPYYIVQRWGRIIDDCTFEEKEDQDMQTRSKFPTFARFCKFIEKEARIACNPVTSSRHTVKKQFKQNERRTLSTRTEEHAPDTSSLEERKLSCIYCNGKHEIDDCEKFKKMSLIDRLNFTRNKSLCRGCLKFGHMKKDCRRKKTCKTCHGFHPTALHDNEYFKNRKEQNAPSKKEEAKPSSQPYVSNCIISNKITHGQAECMSHSMIVPICVSHKDNPSHKEMTYAILDDQSDTGFIMNELVDVLNIDGPKTELKLSTMLATSTISCKKISGLRIIGYGCKEEIRLPTTFTRETIPANHSQIPRQETASRWDHLRQMSSKLMPYRRDLKIGMLIGTDTIKAIKPLEVVPGTDNQPYAIRTTLGWGVIGEVTRNGENDNITGSVFICKKALDDRLCHFSFRTQAKEVIAPRQIAQMFEQDFQEGTKEEYISQDDNKFMDKMRTSIHQLNDGHFELPLPFRNEDTITRLPDNRAVILKRLRGLVKKFERDQQYKSDYQEFMNGIIKKGYAERVPEDEVDTATGKNWYIPHHGVYHPKKPTKIRVVFDCSHTYNGQSLNSNLLPGPDLTNNLVGVLCRFRQDKVAFTCDIESMFYQLKVNAEHRDYLRFYWWADDDFTKDPVTFRMTVHLFGATSSPGCANYGLKAAADLYEEKLGEDAANFIRNNFYVDDGLKSVPTIAEAIDLIQRSRQICSLGGFRLHKFLSNEREVLQTIPLEERSKDVMNFDIDKDPLPVERTLGVQWCVENDVFQFRINLQDKPLTRRGILSTVSSVFDPLGLVSPVILAGKRILQELCKDCTDWDEEVPDSIRFRWIRWREELIELSELKVNRSFKPDQFGEVKSIELHHFSDACLMGYGQCSYLKLTDEAGTIATTLVLAKSRVSPSKPVTVPRLELTAAVTSVKVADTLKRELEYQPIKEYFWSDSKVVLGYVSNDATRFHIYVANRVQQIRNSTSPSQWNYVESQENPADIASRGLKAKPLIDSKMWWKGPDFLRRDNFAEKLSPNEDDRVLKLDDPEVRKIVTFTTSASESPTMVSHFERFSNWTNLKQGISVCLRLQGRIKKNDTSDMFENGVLKMSTVEELKKAELEIVKKVQMEYFSEEIKVLESLKEKRKKNSEVNRQTEKEEKSFIKKSSSLYKLDPFIDENGILRIGGRIQNANIPVEYKHPAVIPKKGHLTELLVRHFHSKMKHQGKSITHNTIRENGFWIIGGRMVTSNIISKCVTCKKLYSPTQEQKMCPLPKDRFETEAPFTYAAVDYFGPWHVKDGRRESKRFGVIFVCMASRAIHLEVSNSMDTDSFINAYRRFVCRRGPVRQLRSDRGSNFIGAQSELRKALKEMNFNKIQNELQKDSCDLVEFKMNFPEASHMGGSWERLIRSVRSVLSALLETHKNALNDEILRTFFAEAECIVNSRPLAIENLNDPNYICTLTPNHILTLKSQVLLPPPGEFVRNDVYLRKRWRRVQFLSNEFWKKWKQDYVQNLQVRQKWHKPVQNLKVNDIVLVKDSNVVRCNWKLGRICQVFPSEADGLVRKVKLVLADDSIDKNGKRTAQTKFLERPVQKLVLLMQLD